MLVQSIFITVINFDEVVYPGAGEKTYHLLRVPEKYTPTNVELFYKLCFEEGSDIQIIPMLQHLDTTYPLPKT